MKRQIELFEAVCFPTLEFFGYTPINGLAAQRASKYERLLIGDANDSIRRTAKTVRMPLERELFTLKGR